MPTYPHIHAAYNTYYISIYNKITLVLCLWIPLTFYTFAQDRNDIQIANEYVLKGDKEKALAVYQSLAKNMANIPLIHNDYLNLMLDLGLYKDAEDYVDRLTKRYEDRINYRLDLGLIAMKAGEVQKADRYFKSIIKSYSGDLYRIKSVSDYLGAHRLTDYAVMALQEARQASSNNTLFTLELANLHRLQGNRDAMVEEYLNYVTQTPGNINYVKNLLQILLSKPEELESLEQLLYEKVQRNPDFEVYSDLLIWVNLQQKNFYGAYIQARAYDRRFKKETSKTLEIAEIALNNGDYESADKSFSFVVKEYTDHENYLRARLGQVRAREAKVKRAYPINKDSVRFVITEYDDFIAKYPDNNNAYEAQLNESMLFAYYLNDIDMAIEKLDDLITKPRVPPYMKAKAKLELGDIYIIAEEPWESTLLYSQVERSQRETPIGYEAKLRNAKLSYYKGEFALAQEHLDILKEATTREIANDAMDLSMLIKENLGFDSAGTALREYAAVELLLYQNKQREALAKLAALKGEMRILTDPEEAFAQNRRVGDTIYTTGMAGNSGILDDVYWLEANLRLKQGEFDQAYALLGRILTEFGEDILADDAYFLQGEIAERYMKDKAKAMEIYRDFLTRFPGSVFAAEARKRYRFLRGDFAEERSLVN